MTESFAKMLTTGGHANSLGKVPEVIEIVLHNPSHIEELYQCLFDDDAWVRMRAADALEKICREHPDWLVPYIDRLASDFAATTQPSIQWHMAQIYRQVPLTDKQKQHAVQWLKKLISTKDVDWIVAANTMETLAQFVKEGSFPADQLLSLLAIQEHHKSSAVVRRAAKIRATLA